MVERPEPADGDWRLAFRLVERQQGPWAVFRLFQEAEGWQATGETHTVEWAHRFANDHGIPSYDAAVVGYPDRMREWNKNHRPS